VLIGRSLSRDEYEQLKRVISGFYCLIVRYGTDQYLQHLASDEERHEGRLRLKVIPIQVIFDQNDNASFQLTLPVHKRLGTQFKCFVEVWKLEEVNQVVAKLKQCQCILDIGQSHSQHRNRIYFLLDHFFTVKTVEGDAIKNNYIFPK
jgi:hypothetical protein